jgi:hypothetical protein
MITQFDQVLRVLATNGVDFLVVGGVAGVAHGASRLTGDLDVVYARAPDNLDRLATALAPDHPNPRGAPDGLPFQWDARTLKHGSNFTLRTDLGSIDLLGEITGGGAFADLVPHTEWMDGDDFRWRCLDLPTLIRTKRAAGRPKDFEAVAELEALAQERGR